MKVTVNTTRILHFLVLISFTLLGAYTLIERFEWNGLSALGFSCTITVQVNNALLKVFGIDGDSTSNAENEEREKRKEQKRNRKGNPKKKM